MGNELKRMNYFDGLLLESEDYNQDKEYQRRLQGFHNRYLHSWGIASGLEVKPVLDTNMEVYVTEGFALDITSEGLDGTDIKESISRQIIIYEGHPDNPIDLSEYESGDDIYIILSYLETNADWDSEKGQGEEIHIWERGHLSHSKIKPEDTKKNIILARVRPKEVTDSTGVKETIIDLQCVYDTDVDGTKLRANAGPSAKVLEKGKIKFKSGDENNPNNPKINLIEEDSNVILQIDSNILNFNGNVNINEDVSFEGQLVAITKDGVIDAELELEESFMQLNSPNEDDPKEDDPQTGATQTDDSKTEATKLLLRDCGMDVFRGGLEGIPDARIVWSEKEGVWKAGLENKLSPLLHGEEWEKLKVDEDETQIYFCEHLHRHSQLSSKKGTALSVDNEGTLSSNVDIVVNDRKIKFFSPIKSNEMPKINEISWNDKGSPFGGIAVDGPVLVGNSGGLLGTTSGGQKALLSWNKYGNVGIGEVNLSSSDDDLEIAGSSRLLIGSNPVRFTSTWTTFPDKTKNQAEICNDTTYHKALMLVGNQSAGQGRKVAIWDRLDVNGFLYVNGNMSMSNRLIPSAGTGNNGIIFPSDPGGGSGDRAWIKYYPTINEACTLELGTSNDRDDNILLNTSGSVVILPIEKKDDNAQDKIPFKYRYDANATKDKFDVYGFMRVLSGSNPLRFTDKWSGFTHNSPKCSEISNDIEGYQSLMIAGNRSGGNERKVTICDDLDVNGKLSARRLQIKGAIVPGVGNCDVKGIMFQRDPYGGGGDAAWIRYYSDTLRGGGENMTLEIGISNDTNKETESGRYWTQYCSWGGGCGYWTYYSRTFYGNKGDRLRLHASGGTYVQGNLYVTSSREYKENIADLSKASALEAIDSLEPVEFNFKGDYTKTTMGFIAEDVSDCLAASDKKAINPMEIITVLVSEVKAQESELNGLKKKVAALKRRRK